MRGKKEMKSHQLSEQNREICRPDYHNQIEKLTGCREDYLVVLADTGSLPTFNLSGRSLDEKDRARYVVRIFEDRELFMVWDCVRRREYQDLGAAKSTYSSVSSWEDIQWGSGPIIDFYKHLGNRGSQQPYEKVAIVQLSFFKEFFVICAW